MISAAATPSYSSRRRSGVVYAWCYMYILLAAVAASGLAGLLAAAEDAAGSAVTRAGPDAPPGGSNLRRRAVEDAHADDLILPPPDQLFLGPNVDPDDDSITPVPRIIGGRPSPVHSQPYMASLKGSRWSGGVMIEDDVHYCGATVIAKNVLLSAAHCWGAAQWAEVGRYDLSDPSELSPGGSPMTGVKAARIRKEREVRHPGYRPTGGVKNNGHDIMLFKLEEDVPDHIEPVMLDLRLFDSPPALTKGDSLLVSGWGVKDSQRNPSSILLDATVFSVPNWECARSSAHGYSYEGAIDETMMCARAAGKDSCQGDSGGPLILSPDDGKWGGGTHIQAGVVSFGIGCAMRDFPGVYSRVSTQAEWIQENVCRMTGGDAPRWFNCNGELDGEKNGKIPVGGDTGAGEEKAPAPIPAPAPAPRPTPAPVRRGRRRRKRWPKYHGRISVQARVAIVPSEVAVGDEAASDQEEEEGESDDVDSPVPPLLIESGEAERIDNTSQNAASGDLLYGDEAAAEAMVRLVADDSRHPSQSTAATAGGGGTQHAHVDRSWALHVGDSSEGEDNGRDERGRRLRSAASSEKLNLLQP